MTIANIKITTTPQIKPRQTIVQVTRLAIRGLKNGSTLLGRDLMHELILSRNCVTGSPDGGE